MKKSKKTCGQPIGRYDDQCGLRQGHERAHLDEFMMQLCGLDLDGNPTPEEAIRRAKREAK